jgi:hypothetical protein
MYTTSLLMVTRCDSSFCLLCFQPSGSSNGLSEMFPRNLFVIKMGYESF